jgi:CMP-N-acetylneuraminic acid synthetase
MLCIIPARAGSKRFPGKNTSIFKGQTLISRTIESAIESKVFEDIIVTSNDPKVIEIARKYPVYIHNRQDELSLDTTRIIEVVKFLLENNEIGIKHDNIALLFVTSPLRTVSDIKEAVLKFNIGKFDSLMSISEYLTPPQFALTKIDNCLKAHYDNEFLRKRTQKQSIDTLFYPNYAIQIAQRKIIFKYDSFFGDRCGWTEIPKHRSVDIDTPFDMKWAIFLQDYVNET